MKRIGAACVFGAAIVFVALMAAAMSLYHGGTWIDPRAPGHDFWLNFFCDLLHDHALDGAPNATGARLATIAMLALIAGMLPFWLASASLVAARPVLAWIVRVAGVTSVVGLVAVPLTPSDRFGALHGVAVLVASVPGLVATACATVGLLATRDRDRTGMRVLGVIALATFVCAAIDATLYAQHMASGGAVTPPALPAIQKVAAMLLIAWMLGVARAAWTTGRKRAVSG